MLHSLRLDSRDAFGWPIVRYVETMPTRKIRDMSTIEPDLYLGQVEPNKRQWGGYLPTNFTQAFKPKDTCVTCLCLLLTLWFSCRFFLWDSLVLITLHFL